MPTTAASPAKDLPRQDLQAAMVHAFVDRLTALVMAAECGDRKLVERYSAELKRIYSGTIVIPK